MLLRPDWLNASPIFFTDRPSEKFFDMDGLQLYWKFGYSVFGTTIDPSTKFLMPWQALDSETNEIWSDASLDPVLRWLDEGKQLTEDQILERLREQIRDFAEAFDGPIIVPLSGGLDSRLILWALQGHSREKVFTYSYGTSWPQARSREVITAGVIASQHGFNWQRIELGDFLNLTGESYAITSHYAHAHAMYHLEFYSKILELHKDERVAVISGSVGDLWAGNSNPRLFKSPRDLDSIRYSHGLHGQSSALITTNPISPSEEAFFSQIEEKSQHPVWRIALQVQNKMMLLRYLGDVASSLGATVLRPFHDIDLALSMASLPSARRSNRVWQREFLERNGFDFGKKESRGSNSNSLLYQSRLISGFEFGSIPSSIREVFQPSFLERVSRENMALPRLRWLNLTTLGGSKKSALLNLWNGNATLRSLKDAMMLDPLIRYAARRESKQ